MGSVLLLGFLIGLRHAIEADHVAAVASLTTRSRSLSAAANLAAAWGLGHTLMLFAVGTVVICLDSVMPERVAQYLELGVGIMLVWLGYDVLRRLIRERIHFHVHRHDGDAPLRRHGNGHEYALHRRRGGGHKSECAHGSSGAAHRSPATPA